MIGPRQLSLLRGLASVVIGLAVWEAIARLFFVAAVLPPPSEIVREMLDHAKRGALAYDIWISVQRVLVGFLTGSALGIALGLAIGSLGVARWLLDPLLQFLRFIPPIAWLTPVIIWFGIGETGKYVLIMYTTMFMVMTSTYEGVRTVHRNRLRAGRCLGADPLQLFLYVAVPSTVPYILSGMQIGMGNSLQTLIVAEMLAADRGLGHLIWNSRAQLNTELVFVGIFVIGVIGFAADGFFRRVTARLSNRYGLA